MKRVSVYVKGNRNSTAYYRIYQYLDRIEDISCNYHTMMSSKIHDKYMPISKQSVIIKVMVYIHIYFRMLLCLIGDLIHLPDAIVIHRRIISRYMPVSFRILLTAIIRRGVPLIWDFDDHIINSREVSISTFRLYTRCASRIIVTHDYLKSLIPVEYQNKVNILPTTDGDMFELFLSEDINKKRIDILNSGEVNLVWVATSVNLVYLESIIKILDKAADLLRNNYGKNLCLKVVCNAPLLADLKSLHVENIKWSRDIAIREMAESHIGIMPLLDSVFSRGKGGFKLIQYMSIGLPIIGSNVGFNREVISHECGFLIDSKQLDDWIDAIIQLSDSNIWKMYSEKSYESWNKKFSYKNNLLFWNNLLKNIFR